MGVSAVQPSTTQEFNEELKGLSDTQIKFLAESAKHDLYIMAKGVLGYPDINPETHKAFCRYLQDDEPAIKRRMGLMPRMHLKSTISTIANPIRKSVKDPNRYRGLITGETETKAIDFLREIKNHWEQNETLNLLYPNLRPEKLAGPGSDWAALRASIKRKAVFKEATYTAIGVGGAATSGHWNHIVCDDLVGLEASRSESTRKMVQGWVENIDPLLTNAFQDVIDFIGTRWSRRDIYAFLMRLYGDRITVFRREIIENGKIIFPAKHNEESIAQLQKTPRVYFAQYCNNPMAEGQTDFPSNSIRTFWFGKDRSVVAQKDGRQISWSLDDLNICLRCDPNGGSKTAEDDAAIIVDAVSPEDDIFVLEAWSGKVSPSALVDRVYETYRRWNPQRVGIEQAGQQSTAHYFELKAKEEKLYIPVTPLKPKNRDKITRIRTAMEPVLATRRLFCLSSQTVLRNQIDYFPDTELIDELDCLAYGAEPEMWQTPDSVEESEEKVRGLELLRNRRNKVTGY